MREEQRCKWVRVSIGEGERGGAMGGSGGEKGMGAVGVGEQGRARVEEREKEVRRAEAGKVSWGGVRTHTHRESSGRWGEGVREGDSELWKGGGRKGRNCEGES
eukprot:6173503-Pleurochrysis_carterae.AAC.4